MVAPEALALIALRLGPAIDAAAELSRSLPIKLRRA
jgi:hypothetical protein